MAILTVNDIVKKANRLYESRLRTWLETGDFEAWVLPIHDSPSDYASLRDWIKLLEDGSGQKQGAGYHLYSEDRRLRKVVGIFRMPVRIEVNSLADYLALIGKHEEFSRFEADVTLIRTRLPQLEGWMRNKPLDVINFHGKWPRLLNVCDYLLAFPRPNRYMRQLSIVDVDTKFIEDHQPILRSLLDFLLPPEAIDTSTTDFEPRYGFKHEEWFIRLRCLGNQLSQHGIEVEDFIIPHSQCRGLPFHPGYTVVVENRKVFLCLPNLVDTIAVWGSGFAAKDILTWLPWSYDTQILYWGDIDAQGFQILSSLRSVYPNTRSVMMDRRTFTFHGEFAVQGTLLTPMRLPHLTEDEHQFFEYLVDHNLRLEQEKIHSWYADDVLGRLAGSLQSFG